MSRTVFASCAIAALLAALSGIRTAGAAAPPKTGPLHEIARWEVGGEGGWDYLTCDPAGHRLFITRGSHVMVVSDQTGKVIGDIPDTRGCHGIALAPMLKRGFISDGGSNEVTIFDLTTLKTTGKVPVGQRPDAILFDPASGRVFTFNAGSSDTTAIDAATGKVIGTLALGGKPEFAQSDGKGHIFVNIEDKSEIVTFDARKLTVVRRTAVAPAEEPSGLAIDPKTHRLFAACGNKRAAIVDGDTGKLIATPEIGDGPDAAAFDPASGTTYTSNGGDGTLSVIGKTASGSYAVDTVKTQRGARTMTLDPTTGRVYLVTAKFEVPVETAAAPAPGVRRPRPRMVPNSFVVLVYGR